MISRKDLYQIVDDVKEEFKRSTQALVGPELIVDDAFMEDLEIEMSVAPTRVEALVDLCFRRGYIWDDDRNCFVKDPEHDEEES